MIESLLDRPIAFHRVFVTVTGSVTAALMLSQACYWQRRSSGDGWFYKTQAEWEDETGMSRREQETARAALRACGVLHERRAGVPAKLYYQVDYDRLEELIEAIPDCHQNGGKRQTGVAESADQACTKAPIRHGGKRPAKRTETTTETTAEKKKSARQAHATTGSVTRINVTVDDMIAELPSLSRDVAVEYLACRKHKHALLTPTAWKTICAEIRASGWSPDAALAEAMSAGWHGLKAAWLANRNPNYSGQPGRHSGDSIHDRRAATIAGLTGQQGGNTFEAVADEVD